MGTKKKNRGKLQFCVIKLCGRLVSLYNRVLIYCCFFLFVSSLFIAVSFPEN